jgi:hypothetical protein
MFHVKLFGTIDGAKILIASYIRRCETGAIARKNGTIARKSVTRPRLGGTAARNATGGFQAQRLGLVWRAERKYAEGETGDQENNF